MVRPCILFSVSSHPSADDDYFQEGADNIAGLAEWFNTIPDLFLLLLGAESQAVPFAAYTEPGDSKALTAPTHAALERWHRFHRLALHAAPQRANELTHIDRLLTRTPHPYLVLDIWDSQPAKTQGKKAWPAFVRGLQTRCAELAAALAASEESALTPPIAAILNDWPRQAGYWSEAVIARIFAIEFVPLEEVDALADYAEGESNSWVAEIPAYIVQRKGDDSETAPKGLVTPYGRWLVPLEANLQFIGSLRRAPSATDMGWLPCMRVQDEPGGEARFHYQLFDVNGMETSPLLIDTFIEILSPTLAAVGPNHASGEFQTRIVRLPDFSLVMKNVDDAQRGDDGFIRFAWPYRETIEGEERTESLYGLMDQEGKVLIEADRYRQIGRFHKGKKLAVAYRNGRPEERKENADARQFAGVIDPRGKAVIPLEFQHILPLRNDAPPKVFPNNRLIAIGYDLRPTIFDTAGSIVAQPPYQVVRNLLYLGSAVHDDVILVEHDDWIWQMSFEGELLARDMSVAEFRDEIMRPLRELRERMEQPRRMVSAPELLAEMPDDFLPLLSRCLCWADPEATETAAGNVADFLTCATDEGENAEDGVWTIAQDASPLEIVFRLAFQEAADMGFAARIDWKDSDALSALADWVAIPALRGFRWNANDNGDSMQEGIEAAAKFVAKSDVSLFLMPADSDMYEIGFVRKADEATLLELASNAGIHLRFFVP